MFIPLVLKFASNEDVTNREKTNDDSYALSRRFARAMSERFSTDVAATSTRCSQKPAIRPAGSGFRQNAKSISLRQKNAAN